MPYKDDLEAAHSRIRQLEDLLKEKSEKEKVVIKKKKSRPRWVYRVLSRVRKIPAIKITRDRGLGYFISTLVLIVMIGILLPVEKCVTQKVENSFYDAECRNVCRQKQPDAFGGRYLSIINDSILGCVCATEEEIKHFYTEVPKVLLNGKEL